MYHYSTVNKYGFRHRFATCVLLVMPVVFLISIFLPPVIAPLLYPYYASQFHVGDGDVGSPASADTPAASSIAEMMENERFTVHPADPYWDDIEGPVILDNVRYYALLLPSGERISARVRLSRSAFRKRWGGRSGKDGLEIIQRLIQSHGIEPPTPDAAWELSQAVQLAGTLYQARLISRDDMDQAYSRAGKKIQGIFSSWNQFCENDLQAFAQWQLRSKPQKEAEKNIKKRLAIYSHLKGQNPGPYTVPWNVDLNWHPADRGGNEITRQILKEYNARI